MDQDASRLGAEDEPSPAPLGPADAPARPPSRPHPASPSLTLRRPIALPRSIVWDALVDPALTAGWLGDLDIDARTGGSFRLRYGAPVDRRPHDLSSAVIRDILEPRVLELEAGASTGAHRVRVHLQDVPGGPRNRSTVLHLEVTVPAAADAGPAEGVHAEGVHAEGRPADTEPAAAAAAADADAGQRDIVHVDAEPTSERVRLRAAWLLHLDQLDELLHGRPVDWTCWSDLQDEAWLTHVADSAQPER